MGGTRDGDSKGWKEEEEGKEIGELDVSRSSSPKLSLIGRESSQE